MNKNKEVTFTYQDVEILYDENKNRWLFTLRGRERSAESLMKAKIAIDAPPPKEEKPFRRFEAWYRHYSGIQRVTVTSMTESGERFWISYEGSYGKKERGQAGNYKLYPCDPRNDAIIERAEVKKTELEKTRTELESIYAELRHVDPKDWEKKP